MSGTRLGERGFGPSGFGRHLCVPLVAAEPLGVPDLDGDRRAESAAVTHTAHQRDLVLLESLPWTPAVAETASRKFVADLVGEHGEAGRQTLHDHGERTAM